MSDTSRLLEEIKEEARSAKKSTLRKAAQSFLTNADVMQAAGDTLRWQLAQKLFPYFTLPTGWLVVARRGGLEDGQIASLIEARTRNIRNASDALNEEAFLRVLAIEEPATTSEAYRTVLSQSQIEAVAVAATRLPKKDAPSIARHIMLRVAALNRRLR